ncbi:MAG: glucosaminidase domain-containing protein [Bacillota bacterium]
MGCIKILVPGGKELQGHLIEERAYCRVRDLAEALGFGVSWQPDVVSVAEKPRDIGPETDLRLPSGANAQTLDRYFGQSPIAGLGKDFIEAELKWRVNAVFAAAVACHESNFGRSTIAQSKKNLFGICAYDTDPYGSARTYGSFKESIEDFCRLISREYLNPGGKYFHSPTVVGVGKRYASDPLWSEKVLKHCKAIVTLA